MYVSLYSNVWNGKWASVSMMWDKPQKLHAYRLNHKVSSGKLELFALL